MSICRGIVRNLSMGRNVDWAVSYAEGASGGKGSPAGEFKGEPIHTHAYSN